MSSGPAQAQLDMPVYRLTSIFYLFNIIRLFLHSTTEHAATSTLLSLCLSLHLLANLDVDFEELGYAAVEADGFALVEIGFPVVCVYAFGCARLDEAGEN